VGQVKQAHAKATEAHHVGAPLQGKISEIKVKEGEEVKVNQPLFVIEAMKMESVVTAPRAGKVGKIHLPAGTLVEQNDLVLELGA
jgi:pyruvate carboxylase